MADLNFVNNKNHFGIIPWGFAQSNVFPHSPIVGHSRWDNWEIKNHITLIVPWKPKPLKQLIL